MSEPMTDEDLRMWAINAAGGDVGHAEAIVAFVRPSSAIGALSGRDGRRRFSPADEAFIREHAHLTPRVVTKLLNAKNGSHCSANAVNQKMRRMGLSGSRAGTPAQIARIELARATAAAGRVAARQVNG